MIGKRRAAQRLMAAALDGLKEDVSDDDVKLALDQELEKLALEHHE